jgi:hypothetical protein
VKSSLVIQRVFEYIQSYLLGLGNNSLAQQTKVSVCDLKEGDDVKNPLVCILPIRDAVAGKYVRQDRVSVELQIVCYAPNYYQIGAVDQLDDLIRGAMILYPENSPPSNFHLVRRFFARWIEKLSIFQSIQIYQFHIIDN